MIKLKRRYLFSLLFITFFPLLLAAQQNEFNWRVGAYGGIITYYGDLSYRLVDPNPKLNNLLFDNLDYASYGFSLERRLSNTFSIGLLWTEGQFIANDRSVNWDGSLQPQNPDFERALNARTELWDASAYLTYHFDNGNLLKRRAFLAPYLKAGIGLTHFNVFGDLFRGPGQEQRYFYWDDGSIRDQPPGTPNAQQIEQDGIYETNLTSLQTEGRNYQTEVLSLSGGLGLKLRFGRFNINLESMLRWVNTDYLDDVSGGTFPEEFNSELQAYASNPANVSRKQRGENDRNDLYAFTSLSLHFNFGRKENEFAAPAIVTGPLLTSASDVQEPPMADTTREASSRAASAEKKTNRTIDSLQQTVDSLRARLTRLETRSMQADRETADSLRISADSLRLRADSLEQRADDLYPVAQDTVPPSEKTDTSVVIHRAPFPSELRDTLTIDKTGAPLPQNLDTIPQGDTMAPPPAGAPDTTSAPSPAEREIMRIEPPDTTKQEREMPRLTVEPDTSRQQLTAAENRELQQLREEVKAPNTKIETRPGADTALQNQVEQLETALLQMQGEIRELRNTLAAQPAISPDSIPSQERLNLYQQELTALRERMSDMEAELPAEERRLVTRYESTVRALEQTDPDINRDRYQQLQREISALRRQLNITTGAGAAVGAAALATRRSAAPVDSLSTQLRVRVDSLERSVQQLRSDPALINTAAAPDTLLTQRIDRLNDRLDSLRVRQRIDPTTDLLRATIRQQQDTLRRQQEILKQQQETSAELRRRIADLQTQLEEMRENINREAAGSPEEIRSIVFFNTGSYTLTVSSRQTLHKVVERVQGNPELQIRLEGYTDSSGSIEVNRRLSEQRTLAVKEYLLRQGVSSNRIETSPQGIDDNAPSPAYGRRVEIILEGR